MWPFLVLPMIVVVGVAGSVMLCHLEAKQDKDAEPPQAGNLQQKASVQDTGAKLD
jgi:hypothetical protein